MTEESAAMPPGSTLVTGATGLLGSAVVRVARRSGPVTEGLGPSAAVDRAGVRLDLTRPSEVGAAIRRIHPRTIVHCAALTSVDVCEAEPSLADLVNAVAPEAIAAVARELGARMIFISTDAVFDGVRGPHGLDAPPGPVNVYARSKLEGEERVRAADPDAMIVRLNLFGWSPSGTRSLLEWILGRLKDGLDVPGYANVLFSPLYTVSVAEWLMTASARDLRGTFHLAADRGMSKFEFAQLVAARFGYDPARVRPTPSDPTTTGVPRPLDTRLSPSPEVAQLLARPVTLADELERAALDSPPHWFGPRRERRTAGEGVEQ